MKRLQEQGKLKDKHAKLFLVNNSSVVKEMWCYVLAWWMNDKGIIQ